MQEPFSIGPQSPTPLVRYQRSLEAVLSFERYTPEPSNEDVDNARGLYDRIVEDCKRDEILLDTYLDSNDDTTQWDLPVNGENVHRPKRYLYKIYKYLLIYCPTEAGCDNVTRMVLTAIFSGSTNRTAPSLSSIISLGRRYPNYSLDERKPVYDTLGLLANELLRSFFMPMKAKGKFSSSSTSSLITPTSRSRVGSNQATHERSYNLRKLILARDGSKCVVTGVPDRAETRNKWIKSGRNGRQPRSVVTEAAHIIPHALNMVDGGGELSDEKHIIWNVMNMFDPNISQSLHGGLIDSPGNALLICQDLHDLFGNLYAYFEEVEGSNNLYNFCFVNGHDNVLEGSEPNNPILFLNNEPHGTARSQLPIPRLLRMHRACCLILHMSGAADYVENLLDDTEALSQRGVLAPDGSSDLGLFLRAKGLCENLGKERKKLWSQTAKAY